MMPIYETFSRRRDQAAKAGEPEIYVYDRMPESLVNQIVMIWNDVVGRGQGVFKIGNNFLGPNDVWEHVERVFQREHGLRSLYRSNPYSGSGGADAQFRVTHFFENAGNNDHRLNIIELVFSTVFRTDIKSAKRYIEELNQRFRLAGVGYQFVEGKLIRLDSTVAHEELVKPALVLLGQKGFEKANEQYRSAHDHYRRDEHPQAITEAAKAFESALKAICTEKEWEYSDGDRASDLVKVVVKNGLFPEWLDRGLAAYVAMISTVLPTVRNIAGAHGTAPDADAVSAYLARYALHMSAANMLMVTEAATRTSSG